MKHIKLIPIDLQRHATINEKWVHDVIAEDPSILGLGDVVVKDRERLHAGAGRLDMLLQDAEGHGRYEMEIQLGATDPSHIIRTIEYWDIERKRYPQYEHTAVIVAEDITSRFLNVIGLFNGSIPIMAIQMKAVQTEGGVSLFFTKVLDTLQRGLVDEDEEVNEPTNRAYWEKRATAKTVKTADQILELCQDFAPQVQLNYNKHYIGFLVDGKVCNFALARPKKTVMNLSIRVPQSEQIDQELEQQGLELLEYEKRYTSYRIRLTAAEITKHADFLKSLLKQAYDRRNAE
jgi:predicted transport protein